MTSNSPLFWFPKTKLLPPQVGQDVLPRPRLSEALHTAVLHHRLTLLSAPAGSGKTTAVAALHHTHPHLPLGWLRLDKEDNDPLIFLAILVAALQSCLPDCGQQVAALLASQTAVNVPSRRLIALLINDILAVDPEPFLLVLDDLHRVQETAVYETLDYLLEHLPPAMHLSKQ